MSSAGNILKIDDREGLARERWVLLAAIVTTGMSFADATALNVALPAVQTEFSATGAQLLWIVNAYGLFAAALLLLGGAMGDHYGRKCVYVTGILGFAIASAACGLSVDTRSLIGARAMQGVGAALMIPGSLALITATVPECRRGRAIGIWTACSVVTMAIGPLLGGMFVRVGWWRGVFLINLPFAAIAVIAISLGAVESRASKCSGRVDLWGAWWSVCGISAVNFALLEAPHRGLRDPIVWAGLCFGVISLVLFVVSESRAAEPILPLRLFRNKTLIVVCLVTLLFYSSLYGMTLFLSLNLIQQQRYNAVSAGLALLPMMLLVVVLSPWIGHVLDRRGPRGLLTVGSLVAGIGYLGLAIPGMTAGPSEYWIWFLPPLLLLGIGMSFTAVSLSTSIMNAIPTHHMGLASGLNSTLSRLSSVLGIAVLGCAALPTFSHTLTTQAAQLSLTDAQRAELMSEAVSFGGAHAPADTPPATLPAIEHAIGQSFLRAFRVVAWACAGASMLAALLAAVALEAGVLHGDSTPRRQNAAA